MCHKVMNKVNIYSLYFVAHATIYHRGWRGMLWIVQLPLIWQTVTHLEPHLERIIKFNNNYVNIARNAFACLQHHACYWSSPERALYHACNIIGGTCYTCVHGGGVVGGVMGGANIALIETFWPMHAYDIFVRIYMYHSILNRTSYKHSTARTILLTINNIIMARYMCIFRWYYPRDSFL